MSSDAGLYVNDTTGLLAFYDGSGMVLGTSSDAVVSGAYAQIVLTRDSSNSLVTVYVNGTAQFSFTDWTNLAALGDATNTGKSFLTVFQDDGQGIGSTIDNESTGGNIARLRLYDGPLSAAQVAALDTVVPEPASWSLLSLGLIALLTVRRSRAELPSAKNCREAVSLPMSTPLAIFKNTAAPDDDRRHMFRQTSFQGTVLRVGPPRDA